MMENSVRCEHCGEVLEEASHPCPGCGMPPSSDRAGGDDDIYLALMHANVLRLRRQWSLAEAKCSEVLRRDPGNSAACSVMGDLARDQGNLREAIEWYKMALDRNPESAVDRKKLEALIDRVFESRRSGRLCQAISKLFEAGRGQAGLRAVRSARLPMPLSLVVPGVLLAILVIALSTIVLGRRAATPPTPSPKEEAAPAFGSAAEASTPRERGAAPALPAELLDREQELLDYVRTEAKRADPNCQVVGAEIDPLDGSAHVRVTLPRLSSARDTRDAMSRSVVKAAGAALDWDGRISQVRVRCDVRERDQRDRPGMVAEVSQEQVRRFRQDPAASMEGALRPVWWAPDLQQEENAEVPR